MENYETSLDTLENLLQASPVLDEAEKALRKEGRADLADPLLKLQQDAGVEYNRRVTHAVQSPMQPLAPGERHVGFVGDMLNRQYEPVTPKRLDLAEQRLTSASAPQPVTYEQLQAMLQEQLNNATRRPEVFDPQAFLADNRIHVQNGSIFSAQDPLLVVHPRELHPANQNALREKIYRTSIIDYPPFFADPNISAVAASLASFVPFTKETKNAMLSQTVQRWLEEIQKGGDADFSKFAQTSREPFKAVVEEYLKEAEITPEIKEFSKNAVMLFLMASEALQRRGHLKPVAAYISGSISPEAAVSKLTEHLGINTQEFFETARTQGVDGVGRLLGLEEPFIQELHRLADHLPKKRFSGNAVANWIVGRQMPGMDSAGVHEKILAGAQARTEAKIVQLKMQVGQNYDVADNIKATEQMIVGTLRYLPPALTETLFLLGTEIAYTPERDLEPIAQGIQAYGFHRKVPKHPDDVEGIYQIFVSGKGDAEGFARVLLHEAHHLFFPTQFSSAQMARVDNLASHDMARLKALKQLMDAWIGGDPQTQHHVMQTLNSPEFSIGGKAFGQVLGNTDMLTFYTQVQHAYDRFQIDSEFYHRSPYPTPESRFQEINSRYSELRFIRLRENTDLLQFIVPGITEIYDSIYMPHIVAQRDDLRQRAQMKAELAALRQQPGQIPVDAATPQIPVTGPIMGKPMGDFSVPQTETLIHPLGFTPAEKPLVTGKPGSQIMATSALQQPLLYQGQQAEVQ